MTIFAYLRRSCLYSMHTTSAKRSAISLAVGMAILGQAAWAADTSINAVSVSEPMPGITELSVDFSNQPVKPTAYELDHPKRLVLDFNNVDQGLKDRLISFNQGNIKDVTAVEGGNTTRLIIGINDQQPLSTRMDNHRLVISMQSPSAAVSSQTPVSPTLVGTSSAPVVATPPAVEPIADKNAAPVPRDTMVVKVNPLLNPSASFSRSYNYDGLSSINVSPQGNGSTVAINVSNPNIPLDIQRNGDELVVRMTGATIPARLQRQTAGAGLVQTVVANNQGNNGVIRLVMNGDYEYKAYQTGSQLNINVTPPKRLTEPTLEERTYTGEPLSLEFQDVSVRTILEVLGQHTNTNIIASDSVSGNITLRLINVPWDQALDIILKSKNLDKRVNGNVIWVAPAQELQNQEQAQLQALQKNKELAPLRTEFIRLNYAQADQLRQMIESRRSATNDSGNGSLLSPRGTVTIDARTNTLIVQDTAEVIGNIRELVSKLDIPVRQVMIEARIVSANDGFSKEMGVKWGILSNGVHKNRDLLVGGSQQTLWDLKKYDMQTITVNGQSISYPDYTITRPDNLNVNLGTVADPAGRIAFGLLSISDLLLDLELSAMQADNKGEVISSPKVLTADKQTAKVMSGTQIPYQEAAASGATSTSFVEAALSLEVTPNITPDGRIGMQLNIENGSPTIINGATAVAKDSIQTNVVVDDGQTVVLGGVFKNNVTNGVTKVPFLGDIPYIDRFFKRTSKTNTKEELLIFITPKLVNDNLSRGR